MPTFKSLPNLALRAAVGIHAALAALVLPAVPNP